MSKCLIQDDYSRMFSPSLAATIGLNEAIVTTGALLVDDK